MGVMLGPNRVIAKHVKSCTYCCYVRCAPLLVGGMSCPKTGATQCQAQFGLPDKGRAIKGFDVCENRNLETLYLLNSLALNCYQPSPEVLLELGLYLPPPKKNEISVLRLNRQLFWGLT